MVDDIARVVAHRERRELARGGFAAAISLDPGAELAAVDDAEYRTALARKAEGVEETVFLPFALLRVDAVDSVDRLCMLSGRHRAREKRKKVFAFFVGRDFEECRREDDLHKPPASAEGLDDVGRVDFDL